MADITITPWKRYGLHRGYANAADGTSLGWIDVATGEVSLHAPATEAEIVASALRTWVQTHDVVPIRSDETAGSLTQHHSGPPA